MTDIYLIECRGVSGLRYFEERDIADCGHGATVRQLIEGQFTRPMIVYKMNPDDKTSSDVSEEIAEEIRLRAYEGCHRLDDGTMDFLERQLGTKAIHVLQEGRRERDPDEERERRRDTAAWDKQNGWA